jgi:hypothetical protein
MPDTDETTASDHHEECPQHDDPNSPLCYCEGIEQSEENYRTEPPGFDG